ncbi:hypothetical protein AVEN_87617-1 [Araneus ventricosus]|uniref:Uncharacterized protein n=1 Tax=Araneus ventricosus TaxID=182803 RepID=A0A4Y2NRP9_ARAVE|nr:hypothetical protein AVEN_87617-1 [Araneus ventricosus]
MRCTVLLRSFASRQFNSHFTSGDPTILPYKLIHSRKCCTVGCNERLPRAWQILDVYSSRLITLTYGAACETLLSAHLFHPAIKREEIG